MSLEITLDTSGLRRIAREEPQKVETWLTGVAETMVGDIKTSFGTGPGGRTYKRGSRYHVASSPGYPPNSDTGAHVSGIRQEPAGEMTRHIIASGVASEYLEMGTAHMAARPYMGPVFSRWQGKIEDDARENLNLE